MHPYFAPFLMFFRHTSYWAHFILLRFLLLILTGATKGVCVVLEMRFNSIILLLLCLILAGCVSPPPADVNNICHVFRQYPHWYKASLDVERRWRVPVPVQMAIVHQESKFDGTAKPPRTKLLWIIPWSRPSTAYGYAQALNGTWSLYRRSQGSYWASRENFADGVDFIGWYANLANRRAGISRSDPYSLYLAYHEGIGGYLQKTYLRKSWLIPVAHKVSARAQIYRAQLQSCQTSLDTGSWHSFW